VNIGYPFCLTYRKCLKTLAGGDPNGVAESQAIQRKVASNLPIYGAFAPKRSASIV
jgi:hypothetical protein